MEQYNIVQNSYAEVVARLAITIILIIFCSVDFLCNNIFIVIYSHIRRVNLFIPIVVV